MCCKSELALAYKYIDQSIVVILESELGKRWGKLITYSDIR